MGSLGGFRSSNTANASGPSRLPPSTSANQDPSTRPPNPFDVSDKVVVITGGGSGIGLIMARALEHGGATVYIVGRRLEVIERAAKENSRFGKMIPVQCDITKRASLQILVENIKAQHGYIDILINNAGIARNLYPHPLPTPADAALSPVEDLLPPPPNSPSTNGHSPSGGRSSSTNGARHGTTNGSSHSTNAPSIKAFQSALWDSGDEHDFADIFETNVTAVYYTTVAFLDLLHRGNLRQHQLERRDARGEKGGQIHTDFSGILDPGGQLRPPYHASQVLSVSSSGSFRRDDRVLSPSYTLSKAACTHLGKMLASLLAPWGIRSNVLAPGVWPTDMTSGPSPNSGVVISPDALVSAVPLKRVGTEEDMAGTILYLCSRAGAYANGAVWLLDGGRIGTVPSTY